MKRAYHDMPVLFFNKGEEDREAFLSLKASGIPCEFRAPTLEEPTPLLLAGYQRFIGIEEIKKFVVEQSGRATQVKQR